MSDYDPYSDPRYVPPEVDIPEQERALVEEELAEIEARIQGYDQMLLMFASPGWDMLQAGLVRLAEELDVQLNKEMDQASWKFYRGQLGQVEWFQQMPREIAETQRRLRATHASLLQALGKE